MAGDFPIVFALIMRNLNDNTLFYCDAYLAFPKVFPYPIGSVATIDFLLPTRGASIKRGGQKTILPPPLFPIDRTTNGDRSSAA